MFLSVSLQAQYVYTPPVYTPLQAITSDVAYQGMMSYMRPQTDGDLGPNPAEVEAVSLTYKPDKSLTPVTLATLARRVRATDPATAAQMERDFALTDIVGAVQGVMGRLGLETNNVAHAYALYWVVYWGLANNVHDAPSPQAMQAVARQAEAGFAANPEFVKFNDAQKQQLAEELMVLAALMDSTSEQAKSDSALATQSAKAALQGSRASGLQLDKMTLTEDGFVPKS